MLGEHPDYPSTSAKLLPTTMPLQGDVYVVENKPSTYIIRLERREGSNDHPGVGFRETKLKNLIARMEREAGHWDALQGTWNSDALFGFAVRAILDHQARPSCLGEDRVWRQLLEMGFEGGEMPGRAEGDLGSMQAIRYAAVITNELMRRQEGLEDWVRPGDCGRSGSS